MYTRMPLPKAVEQKEKDYYSKISFKEIEGIFPEM